jgi:hypothetical protein
MGALFGVILMLLRVCFPAHGLDQGEQLKQNLRRQSIKRIDDIERGAMDVFLHDELSEDDNDDEEDDDENTGLDEDKDNTSTNTPDTKSDSSGASQQKYPQQNAQAHPLADQITSAPEADMMQRLHEQLYTPEPTQQRAPYAQNQYGYGGPQAAPTTLKDCDRNIVTDVFEYFLTG